MSRVTTVVENPPDQNVVDPWTPSSDSGISQQVNFISWEKQMEAKSVCQTEGVSITNNCQSHFVVVFFLCMLKLAPFVR